MGGAAQSPGRDGAAIRGSSGAVKVQDGHPRIGRPALRGETGAARDVRRLPGPVEDGRGFYGRIWDSTSDVSSFLMIRSKAQGFSSGWYSTGGPRYRTIVPVVRPFGTSSSVVCPSAPQKKDYEP